MLSKEHILKLQAEQLELAQKHEEESFKLAEEALRLSRQHRFQVQTQQRMQAESILELASCKQAETPATRESESQHNDDEGEEYYRDTVNALIITSRQANDELSEAHKMAVEIMEAIDTDNAKRQIRAARRRRDRPETSTQDAVRIKMVGSINQDQWAGAFKRKYKGDDDWDVKMAEELSTWEAKLSDPSFQPFNMVPAGNGEWKEELGDEVYNSVITALLEMEEYNASGRYPFQVVWNFEEARKASLKEVIVRLGSILDLFLRTNHPNQAQRPTRRSKG